jgi:flagellum-specific peptidoglycan hydrolase FlgJ
MPSASKPWWQQATALVSLGAGGAVTGFSFVPQPAADMTSPTSLPVHLMALEQSARPAVADDGALRSAIVNVANYYRRMAESKTPAEMEAIIWQHDSTDGANHGESCAAFASLTLELGAHVTGQQSWVTGGSSYPWPLHDWVDARVNPNPGSLGITSIVQDAESHHRWHALGDGYQPLPGDWVVFNGHVEVVTKYAGGVLSTIGGDSLPNFSVNAHEYPGPLASQGVVGFVNNGTLPAVADKVAAGGNTAPAGQQAKENDQGSQHQAASSGPPAPAELPVAAAPAMAAGLAGATADTTVIPGLPIMAHRLSHGQTAPSAAHYKRHNAAPAPGPAPVHDSSSQQAFIGQIAPGAMAAQRKYGVPASVTIAQAIDESGWGQSTLATRDHNLFGIKGTGPAGSVPLATQEYQNGQLVTSTSSFRVYNNTAESIDDHGKLLATSGFYRQSMADRQNPNAFAQALTGIYATDPSYGTKLIGLMRQYNLYRYDVAPAAAKAAPASPVGTTSPVGATSPAGTTSPAGATIPGLPVPGPTAPASRPTPAPTPTPVPTPSGSPASGSGTGTQAPTPGPGASGPAQASPGPTASPTGSPPSAGPSAAPSAASSAGPTPSAAPSGQVPAGRQSSMPATRTPSARPTATPAAPTRSAAPSHTTPLGQAPAASRSRPTRSRPAPSRPAPSASMPSGTPSRATSGGPGPAAAPAGPVPSGRPAPAAPTGPAPSAAPSGSAPSVQPSAPPSPAVPGLPVAAAAPAQGEPSGQAPASAPQAAAAVPLAAAPAGLTVYAGRMAGPARKRARKTGTRHTYKPAGRYHAHMPPAVRNAFVSTARVPLLRAEPLYQDVASYSGISWELLAACDWMQCEARGRYSPVHGEKLGSVNRDGTSYHTKSEALEQCAEDLVELAETVYGIDLTAPAPLSVRDLANAFAAFRWGGLLRLHRTSAMEFPYSVAGLTPQHTRMRWPKIADPNTPDRPGSRFRKPFGAVPIVLSLNYPATV